MSFIVQAPGTNVIKCYKNDSNLGIFVITWYVCIQQAF